MTLKNEFLTAHSISGGIGMNENIRIADKHAVNFAKWLIDLENYKEVLGEHSWEEILNQYYIETQD